MVEDWPRKCIRCDGLIPRPAEGSGPGAYKRRKCADCGPRKRLKTTSPKCFCVDCGTALEYYGSGARPLRCDECRTLHINAYKLARLKAKRHDELTGRFPRPCETCGKTIELTECESGLRGRRFCSRICQPSVKRARLRSLPSKCHACGVEFCALGSRWRFCSDECRSRTRSSQNRAKNAKRRGARREAVDYLLVFARDDWRCQICRKPVLEKHSFPHPQSATVDHIVPLSKGGSHTLENVQLAHFGCNARRHNRGPAQLRMEARQW